MKSIRTDHVKITAKDLGARVGDRFVVLSEEDSFGDLYQPLPEGTVVILSEDDDTAIPRFNVENSSASVYLNFRGLARYEEPKEDKIVLDKVKFNMVAISKSLNVSLSEAHNIVQNMLFEQGSECGVYGKSVQNEDAIWIYVENGILMSSYKYSHMPTFPVYGVKIEKSFFMLDSPEIIEVNGKKYQRID